MLKNFSFIHLPKKNKCLGKQNTSIHEVDAESTKCDWIRLKYDLIKHTHVHKISPVNITICDIFLSIGFA